MVAAPWCTCPSERWGYVYEPTMFEAQRWGDTTTTAGKPSHLHSSAVHAVQRLATSIHAVQRLATSVHAVQRLATLVHTVQRTSPAVLAMQIRATTDLAMQRATPVHAAAEGPTKEM